MLVRNRTVVDNRRSVLELHRMCQGDATMAPSKGFTAPVVMALGGWKTERMMCGADAAVTDTTLRLAAEAVAGSEVVPVSARVSTS